MSESQSRNAARDEQLSQIIADYLEAERAGHPPDRESLRKQHPDLADDLQAFFADHDRMNALASPVRPAGVEPPASHSVADEATLPPQVAFDTVADRSEAPRPGAIISYFGDYELLEEIARGGMGVVYKARQTKLNRLVALKMILTGQLASKEDVQRFHSEAEAAANLDHPGIVPIFEVGEHEGRHYFSMGYVEGNSLAGKLLDGPLPPRRAAELLRTVAEAVQYAHENGVIHRDLKPANILLDKDGQPRVTDFGLAKQVKADSGLTATGQILGTPSYMPPEQASGLLHEVREVSDVYSLGAVLYAALTGRPPFQADNPLDTLLQVVEREPVSPRQLNPAIPRDLETICLKCLQKARWQRYASAMELADDLGRFLKGEPITARPVSRPARAWLWTRRHPARAGLMTVSVVAVIALIAVAVGSTYQRQLEDKNEELQSTNGALSSTKRRLEGTNSKLQVTAGQLQQANQKLQSSLALETRLRGVAQLARNAEAKARRAETNAKDDLDQVLYFRRVNLALAEWKVGEVARARRLLAECPKARRGWEWYYVNRICHPEASAFRLSGNPGIAAVFSRDGEWLASSSLDSVKLWHVGSGRLARTLKSRWTTDSLIQPFFPLLWIALRSFFPPDDGTVTKVAFSPDGKRVAITYEERQEIEMGTVVQFLARENTSIWDTTTGRHHATVHDCGGVAFGPDGKRIAGSSEKPKKIQLWDVETGRHLLSLDGAKSALSGPLAFSPDGKWIAGTAAQVGTSAKTIHTVNVWDASTGRRVRTLTLMGHDANIESLMFTPDGREIVTASRDHTARVWNVLTGRAIRTLRGHSSLVTSVAISRDGARIATGSYDNTVKIWNAVTGQHMQTLKGSTGPIEAVAFCAGGDQIAAVSLVDRTARVWKLETSQFPPAFHGQRVAVSSNGRWIATADADKTVGLWDAASGRRVLTIKESAASIALSPDSRRIATGSRDTVKVWDISTGRAILRLQHKGAEMGRSLAFSPDGSRLAAGGSGRAVKVWDAATGREIFTAKGHQGHVFGVAFSPDGKRIASASSDETLKVWDATTGRQLITLEGHSGFVFAVAFSADGKRIVSGSDDRTVKVWDAATGREVMTLNDPASIGSVFTSVAFSPDGMRVIAGSRDKTVKVWDATGGRDAITLKGHTNVVLGVAFSPDGMRIYSASGDRTVRVWDGSSRRAVER